MQDTKDENIRNVIETVMQHYRKEIDALAQEAKHIVEADERNRISELRNDLLT